MILLHSVFLLAQERVNEHLSQLLQFKSLLVSLVPLLSCGSALFKMVSGG